MTADRHGLTALSVLGRYELDPALAVPVVVPAHKRDHPLTGLVLAGERLTRVIRPLLRQIEIEPHTPYRGGQVGDVPVLHLIRV